MAFCDSFGGVSSKNNTVAFFVDDIYGIMLFQGRLQNITATSAKNGVRVIKNVSQRGIRDGVQTSFKGMVTKTSMETVLE